MSQPPVAPPVQPQQIPPRPASGLAIASLILGILSIVLLCLWFLSVPLGIIAIILGVVALNQAKAGRAGGKGMAKGGVICGIVGIALTILLTVAVWAGVSFLQKNSDKISQSLQETAQKYQEKAEQLQKAAQDMQKAAEQRQKEHPAPAAP